MHHVNTVIVWLGIGFLFPDKDSTVQGLLTRICSFQRAEILAGGLFSDSEGGRSKALFPAWDSAE